MNNFQKLFDSTSDWLFGDISRFSVSQYKYSQRLIELIKPVGELILAASIVGKIIPEFKKHTGLRVLEYAWEEFDNGSLLQEILTTRPDLLVLASIYANFKREGFESRTLEAEIAKIAGTPGYMGVDLPAWRKLDLFRGLNDIGSIGQFDLSDTFSRTWLAQCHSPWTMIDSIAYGVTHTIFYMTEFGESPNGLPEKVRSYLEHNIPAWTKSYIDDGNFDLAAELMMCDFCIGHRNKNKFIADAFLDAQLPDGAIPGPEYGARPLLNGEKSEDRIYFFKNYHTTLVSFVASAMSI